MGEAEKDLLISKYEYLMQISYCVYNITNYC